MKENKVWLPVPDARYSKFGVVPLLSVADWWTVQMRRLSCDSRRRDIIQTHLMPKWLPPWPCWGPGGFVERCLSLFPSRQFPASALTSVFLVCSPECPAQHLEATCLPLLLGFQPAWFGIGFAWVSRWSLSDHSSLLRGHFKGQSTFIQSPTPHLPDLAEKQALACRICKEWAWHDIFANC